METRLDCQRQLKLPITSSLQGGKYNLHQSTLDFTYPLKQGSFATGNFKWG